MQTSTQPETRQSETRQSELTVSVAASLKEAMWRIATLYRKQRPNVKLHFNVGASGALQKQIENGAPVDVFVSAADKNTNALASRNLIEASSQRVVARNRLVLVVPTLVVPTLAVPPSSTRVVKSFRDLARDDVRNVAIGIPASVPAGRYAQQVLTHIGAWPKVSSKAIRSKDVRAVLAQVEMGNVDAGIVYRSDAATSKKVRVVAVAPDNLHAPIRYPAAVILTSRNATEARRFVHFLGGAQSQEVFRALNFVAP